MKPLSPDAPRRLFAFAIVVASSAAALGQSAPEIIWEQPSHAGTISALAVSPTGDRVVTGTYTAIGIRSWACADGTPLGTIPAYGPVLAYAPDGQIVAAAVNNSVYLWEIADGTLTDTVNEFVSWPPIVSLAYSPNGLFLAGGDGGASTKIFDTALYEEYWQFDLPSRAVTFSPDNQLFALGGANGFTRLWSMNTHLFVRVLGFGDWHTTESIAFSPDGQTIVSGGGPDFYARPGSIKWWRVSDGVKLRQTNHTAAVTSVAFSPDGRLLLACAGPDLFAYKTNDGALRATFAGVNATRVAFAPNGQTFFYGTSDGRVVAARNPLLKKGDLDCNGAVDFFDIDPLVVALNGEAAYSAAYPDCIWLNADCDGDSHVDFYDIDPFVALIGTAGP